MDQIKKLSDTEIEEIIRKMDRMFLEEGYEKTYEWALRLIKEYPNCNMLIWQAAVMLDARRITDKCTNQEKYDKQINAWYELALHDENEEIQHHAADSLFGKGLGKSLQKLGYIPESQNDMIFSVICEEIGLFGAFCLIALFVVMLWRINHIAQNAPDLYGSMLAAGVFAHIAIQVILNIAVVTNTIPNTGVSLPFISYGGTSIVFLMAEMGLALSVARQIKFEE